jgi:hypothetical protein
MAERANITTLALHVAASTAKSIIIAREHQIIKRLGTDKFGLNHNQGS